jgi:hypothetical protein
MLQNLKFFQDPTRWLVLQTTIRGGPKPKLSGQNRRSPTRDGPCHSYSQALCSERLGGLESTAGTPSKPFVGDSANSNPSTSAVVFNETIEHVGSLAGLCGSWDPRCH